MRNCSIQRMTANSNCLIPLAFIVGNAFIKLIKSSMNSVKHKQPPCVEQAAGTLLSELRYGCKELHPRAHAPTIRSSKSLTDSNTYKGLVQVWGYSTFSKGHPVFFNVARKVLNRE